MMTTGSGSKAKKREAAMRQKNSRHAERQAKKIPT